MVVMNRELFNLFTSFMILLIVFSLKPAEIQITVIFKRKDTESRMKRIIFYSFGEVNTETIDFDSQ